MRILCGPSKLWFGSFQSALCTISPGRSPERVNGDDWRRVMLFSQWISYRWAEEAECVIDAAPQESSGVVLYGEKRRERMKEGEKEWEVKCLKRKRGEELCLALALGDTALFINVRQFTSGSEVAGNMMSTTMWSNEKVTRSELWDAASSLMYLPLSLCFPQHSYLCLCVSVGRKEKGLFPYRNSLWFMFPLLWSVSCAQPQDKPFQVV